MQKPVTATVGRITIGGEEKYYWVIGVDSQHVSKHFFNVLQ
jgi:hypothetical protein